MGIYLTLSIVAVIIIFTLLEDFDESRLYGVGTLQTDTPKVLLRKCARQLIKPYQLLWFPMMAFSGLRASLFLGEWNNVRHKLKIAL